MLALAPGIRLRHDKARDRWVLLGPERGYVLNTTGATLLRALVANDLDRQLAALADGDQTREQAMAQFLDELVAQHLLERT